MSFETMVFVIIRMDTVVLFLGGSLLDLISNLICRSGQSRSGTIDFSRRMDIEWK